MILQRWIDLVPYEVALDSTHVEKGNTETCSCRFISPSGLVIRSAFLVLILGFHVIEIDCRDKLHVDRGFLRMCTALLVVLDFQTLQIQQLVVVNDPSTRFKIRHQNF